MRVRTDQPKRWLLPLLAAIAVCCPSISAVADEVIADDIAADDILTDGEITDDIIASETGAEKLLEVTIIDPYVDMHTGPGRGYPVTHVIERGETTTLLKRRTDWIKIRNERGKTGWAHRDDLSVTLGPRGERYEFDDPNVDDYLQRRWSAGFAAGDFDGADTLSANLGYRFSHNLSLEGKVAHAIGNFSDSLIAGVSLVHETWPDWRVSPFFSLGVAVIDTSPDATLVQTEDRRDNMMMVGMGAQIYLSRRFVLRLEYTSNIILTSRNDNQEVDEWKLGFNVFF